MLQMETEGYRAGLAKIQWRNPNHMLLDSGCKTYDAQVQVIGTGNIIANTQLGTYVRSRKEIECNGHSFPEGHLRDFDLKLFRKNPALAFAERIEQFVLQETEDKSVIVYAFFHRRKNVRVMHGYIITDTDHDLLRTFTVGRSRSRHSIMAAVEPYVAKRKEK